MLQNLKTAIREKFVMQKLAAEALEMNAGNLTKLIKSTPEEAGRMRNETISKLERVFSEYNIEWILGRSEIKYKEDAELSQSAAGQNSYSKMPNPQGSGFLLTNGKGLGAIADDEMAMFDDEGNTKFYEISPGVYRMKVPLVPETAKAGYLTGFADAEYLEDQEYIVTTVYKYHKGKYRAFRVIGDSMDVDRRTTFVHGDVIIGRELKKELWNSRFHTHKYPFYVFVTKNDGILFKELTSHDVENGILTLHSLNEDKDAFPDFELNLEDVALVFNIVKRESEI
ncbi:hypothetical protein B0I21_103281 [Sphingobacterium paludis]|uniref:Uncharacterized protein n=2 Tax=Sphingobacterium paludis TaxID=1476465 RepID=A0A4R7D3A3_9SPHI|nr:hypothetical protein B0I21_103281 [Sphingobacterium paludis]